MASLKSLFQPGSCEEPDRPIEQIQISISPVFPEEVRVLDHGMAKAFNQDVAAENEWFAQASKYTYGDTIEGELVELVHLYTPFLRSGGMIHKNLPVGLFSQSV